MATVASLCAARPVAVVGQAAAQTRTNGAPFVSATQSGRAFPRSAKLVAPRRCAVSVRTSISVRAAATATVEDSGLSKADPSRWITGFTPNNQVLRFLAVAATLAVASQFQALGMSAKALTFIHQCVWASWFGSLFYTTFVAGIVMFKSLPRQTFRDVQEVLFPAYFQQHTLAISLLFVIAPLALSGAVTNNQWTLLGVSLVGTLANLMWLEPATTKVMKARAALEKMSLPVAGTLYPEGKDKAMKKFGADFGKYHGLSSLANLVVMCTCIAYGHSLL